MLSKLVIIRKDAYCMAKTQTFNYLIDIHKLPSFSYISMEVALSQASILNTMRLDVSKDHRVAQCFGEEYAKGCWIRAWPFAFEAY